MPALPWLDERWPGNSWRHAAARRLRELAERLEPPLHRGAGAGVRSGGRPAGVVGMRRGVGTEGRTPVRRLDMSGAPEHWVQLLRDAGLVPSFPDPRSHIPPSTPNPPAHIPPSDPNPPADIPPSTPNARSHPDEYPPSIVRETGSPASRWNRVLEPASRRFTRESPIPDDGPAPGAPSPTDALTLPEAATAPKSSFLPRLTLGKRLQSAHAAGSSPVRAPEPAAAASFPSIRPSPSKDSVETLAIPSSEAASPDAPQPRHVLRLLGTRPANATTRPAPGQAKQHQEPPAAAIEATPPNASPANATPPNATPPRPPTTPLHRPPEAARAVVVGLKNAEHQGHPSTTPDHAPAAPTTGNWPELAPRPAPQPTDETPAAATAAMARAARLSHEQLAV